MAASTGRLWRWSSWMVRPANASPIASSRRSASAFWPSASRRPIGPVVPPVSSSRPAACSAMRSNGSCGFRVGSVSRKPNDDRRWRLAMPAASWASSTSGSGGRRGLSVRASAIWQPMIGWMPLPAQYCENSSAPNRLPVSVMAAAGMSRLLRQCDDLVGADGALAERIGGMGAEVDEVSVGHAGRVSDAVEFGQESLALVAACAAGRPRSMFRPVKSTS